MSFIKKWVKGLAAGSLTLFTLVLMAVVGLLIVAAAVVCAAVALVAMAIGAVVLIVGGLVWLLVYLLCIAVGCKTEELIDLS